MSPDRGLLKPDGVIFLDLDIEVAKSRGGFGDERYETEQIQVRVRELFHRMVDESWSVVNADMSVDQLHDKMMDIVNGIIDGAAQKHVSHELFK